MVTVGIICEYNPFHEGHMKQIEEVRKLFGDDARIIALMSGNAVQRGELAICHKYKRAEIAVKSGISAVLELPYPFSSSCAELFAFYGVKLLDSLGGIDHLVFGSECGDIYKLRLIGDRLSSREFNEKLLEADDKKTPLLLRKSKVYKELYGEELTDGSNDILGIEYINALKRLNSCIKPVTYKREEGFTAKGARKEIREGGELSKYGITAADISTEDITDSILLSFIRRTEMSSLSVFDTPKDLLNRMDTVKNDVTCFSELVNRLTCTGNTSARIKRSVLYAYFGVESVNEDDLSYTLLLGADKNGRDYIKECKKRIKDKEKNGQKGIYIITKQADYKAMPEKAAKSFERYDLRLDSLYAVTLGIPATPTFMLKLSPYIEE